MRWLVPVLVVLLVGCASPGPGFLGAERQDVTVDGLRFAVFRKQDKAQVIRLSVVTPRQQRDLLPKLLIAAMRATGCRASPWTARSGIPGDTGVATFDLDCDSPLDGA